MTAERRNARLVDTPITIAVIKPEVIAQRGVNSLLDIGPLVPGLRMDLTGNNLEPTIRGISATTVGPGTAANTAIYVDGVYIASQSAANFDLVDITDIQVLKGPQGTLFGRNATGGAILVTTAMPPSVLHGALSAGYGSYNEFLTNGMVGGPITDTLGAVLTASYRSNDGYDKNVFTGSDTDGRYRGFSVGGKLRYAPTDKFSVLAEFAHSDVNDRNPQVYHVDAEYGANSYGFFIPGTVVTTEPHRDSTNVPTLSRSIVDRGSIVARLDLGFAQLTSLTGLLQESDNHRVDLDGSSATLEGFQAPQINKNISQEISLSSSKDKFSWAVGLYYFHDDGLLPYAYVNPVQGLPSTSILSDRVTTSAYAAFGDATYQVLPKLYLTAGLRYSNERKEQTFYIPDIAQRARTFERPTPRVVIRYKFDPGTDVYASYTRGFKSGTFDPFTPNAPTISPEDVDAFEVGFKHQKGRLSFDVSSYYYDYKNLQVTSYIPGSVTLESLQNAARSKIYGVDGQFAAAITDNLSVRLAAAYTHGEYTSFPGATGVFPASVGYMNAPVDASGNRTLLTPRFTSDVSADYTVPTMIGRLDFEVSLSSTSRVYFDAPNQFAQGGYGLLGASAKWTSLNEKWSLNIIGRNLTDKDYRTSIGGSPLGVIATDGAPLFVRGIAAYKF